MEENEMLEGSLKNKWENRPPYSFSGLIIRAIQKSPEQRLTLKGIYDSITNEFPYYRDTNQNWRNSVRHNLSLHSYFINVESEGNTQRNFWMINPKELHEAFQHSTLINEKMVNKTTNPTLSTRDRRCSKNLSTNSKSTTTTTKPKKVIMHPKEKDKTVVEKREIRSRNAKTKAALEISSSSTTTTEKSSDKDEQVQFLKTVKKSAPSQQPTNANEKNKNSINAEKPKKSPNILKLTPNEQRLMNGQKNSSINSFQTQADIILANNKKSCSNGPPPTDPLRKPMMQNDFSKPPAITNYMSMKFEVLMSCLEKMYHNHLPLNAFTSRYPSARAKAMLTLMLDCHRKDCKDCDKILTEENLGLFHGDENDFKMDLENYGPTIPTQAPPVDLSQYPDDIAAMKKMLVDKDAKIKALTARLKALNKEVPTDDMDKLDIVEMLDLIHDPTMDKHGGKFLNTAGYRLVDLKLLRMALEMSQSCHHGKLTLAEMSPDVKGNREDLVTRLAFVCKICGPKVIFPTSPFSKNYPSNYSANKLLLPLIGPNSYFHLVEFLQNDSGIHQEIITPGMFNFNKPPHLLVSADNAFHDFARPFDPPLPTDPDANIMFGGKTETIQKSGNGNKQIIRMKPYFALRETPKPPSLPQNETQSPMKQIQTVDKNIQKGSKSVKIIKNGIVFKEVIPEVNKQQTGSASVNQKKSLPVISNRKKQRSISEDEDDPVTKKAKINDKNQGKIQDGKKNSSQTTKKKIKVKPVINARTKDKVKKDQEGKGVKKKILPKKTLNVRQARLAKKQKFSRKLSEIGIT